MNRKKLIIIGAACAVAGAAVVILLVILLGGRAEEKEMPLPEEYIVESTTLAALPEQEGMTVAPLESDEEGVSGYSYEQISDVAALLSDYAATLTENGMCYVDDGMTRLDEEPDWTTESGEARLAQELEGGEQSVAMHLTWGVDNCTVALQTIEQGIRTLNDMTFMETVDYLYTLDPEQLGLEGDMQDYRIYAADGAVVVDNRVCIRLDVYQLHPELSTNMIAGIYLVTPDGRYLYELEDGTATRLN